MNNSVDSIPPQDIVRQAMQALDIQLEHSPESLAETRYWLANTGLDDPLLTDLSHLSFVTIDNEDSRDLDQALYITRTDDGYQVKYALADASYYIRPGSALFADALQRGTTYYAPTLSAPMLPVALSEGLISLNPDVLRRALVFDISLNDQATVMNCTIVRASIRSRAKLSYQSVQQWLDSDKGDFPSYGESLQLLEELGQKLIIKGEERGVIDFDRTETRINITGSPPRLQASVRSRFDTERYNEQISLLCNMQGAELLLGLAGVSDVLQAVFRVHEAPLRKSLGKLKDTLNALADTYPDLQQWRWKNGQSLAQFVSNLPDGQQHRRRVRAIQRQIMQAQRGSTFKPEPGEHHALKACSYARFSSPMREIVGIFTHKELIEALSGARFDNDSDELLREQVIDAANNARQLQRKLDKQIIFATLDSIFTRDLTEKHDVWRKGTVMGMRTDKLYINLDDMAIDVKVYREDLEAAQATAYQFEEVVATPEDSQIETWLLGQGIELRIQSIDVARKRFIFDMRPLKDNSL